MERLNELNFDYRNVGSKLRTLKYFKEETILLLTDLRKLESILDSLASIGALTNQDSTTVDKIASDIKISVENNFPALLEELSK